jgi:DNA-directed RNA polymerase subunit RPC12/RpoP
MLITEPGGMTGIALTNKGFDFAAEIRALERQEKIDRLKAAHLPQKVFCGICGESHLQTTYWYNPNLEVTGKCLKSFGPGSDGNWSLPFGDDTDSTEAIVCPGCGGRILDDAGRIPKERLHAI